MGNPLVIHVSVYELNEVAHERAPAARLDALMVYRQLFRNVENVSFL